MLLFSERRPADVNVDQAESLAGAAQKSVIHHSDVFQMKPNRPLLNGQGAIRYLRGPEETRGKDGAVEIVNLGARTGLEQVNSYLDKGAAVVSPIRGHVFALRDPDIASKGETVALTVCGRACKHGYTCEALEVRDGARLDVKPVIADGRWTGEE